MKRKQFSCAPFLLSDNFADNTFLIVHQGLVENSELIENSILKNVARSGEFFTFTFRQIEKITKLIAQKLFDEKLTSQKLVPILMNNPFDLILNIIGLWRAHAVPAPLNIQLTNSELEEQINFLEAENIICDNTYQPLFTSKKKISFADHSQSGKTVAGNLKNSELALVLFTSGTSGKPKAVPLSFNNLISAFNSGKAILNYAESDSWYLNLPLYHISGFSILARALLAGSSIILPLSNEVNHLKKNLPIVQPTLISLVPTQLKRICENSIEPNHELRAVLIGGGFSNEALIAQANKLGWKIHKVYGSTETSAFITALTPEDFAQNPNSIGKALPEVEIVIYDEKRNALNENEVGEIGVKSSSVFNGYLQNKDATASSFFSGYYLTGDFGYYDSDKFFYLEHRRTDLIVSGGENISPKKIERVISKYRNVSEVCVFGLPDKEWGEVVTAALVLNAKSEINFSQLKVYLKKNLAPFKVPKLFFMVKKLPKSAIGKVKVSELKKIVTQQVSSHI